MNKTALVTGASRGIGKAIATSLAKEGYDLYMVCRNNGKMLVELSDELRKEYGINTWLYTGDVSNPDFAREIFSNISQLDVLINNAGISHFGLLSDMSDDEWKNLIGCNLDSVFYFSREAVKLMIQNHNGHIINISSVWGERGASYESAYSASKGGINSLTKALAKELAISGISVNALALGMIDTDMNRHLNEEEIKEIVNDIPIDRMGTPEEVGQMVINIIKSPKYLTGQIINFDGAWQ